MNLLSIGGSDPSSGAGVQGDIKTFGAYGAYGLTIVTAVTAQNTTRFSSVEPVSYNMLESQLDSILSDFEIAGIKIGMVYTSQAAKIISDKLSIMAGSIPIVTDPVIQATTGGSLLREDAMRDYTKYIIPLSTAITPNVYEAQAIMHASSNQYNKQQQQQQQQKDTSPDHLLTASNIIRQTGTGAVIMTGVAGRGSGSDTITDIVALRGKEGGIDTYRLHSRPIIPEETHGGGCVFSAVLLCGLARGKTVLESAKMAQMFVTNLMQRPAKVGSGIGIISHNDKAPTDELHMKLEYAINQFVHMGNMYKYIPECQTNFVYSKPHPHTTKDVLGVCGRIVRTGNKITIAGQITYGGSKHVATALIAVSKKFPHVRSAMNIKYDDNVIRILKSEGMNIQYYDRSLEPSKTKSSGSTIRWGTAEAIAHSESYPDAICHSGDYGKEPMIILFGISPEDVLVKIKKIRTRHKTAKKSHDMTDIHT